MQRERERERQRERERERRGVFVYTYTQTHTHTHTHMFFCHFFFKYTNAEETRRCLSFFSILCGAEKVASFQNCVVARVFFPIY